MSKSSCGCKGKFISPWFRRSAVCLSAYLLTTSPALASYQNPAFDRGMGHMSHRDFDGAINDFGEAIGFNDTDPKNYLMRGKCFFHTDNYELAIQDFNKSIQYAPNDSEAYLWRGTAHANLGKDDFAIKDYEKAISLDPNLADRFFNQTTTLEPAHQQGRVISRNGRREIVSSNRAYETKDLNQNAIHDYQQAMALVYPDRQTGQASSLSYSAGRTRHAVGRDHWMHEDNWQPGPDSQANPSADMHTDQLNNADVGSDQSLRKSRNERVVKSLDTDPNRGEFGPIPGTGELRGDPDKVIQNMNDAIENDASNPQYFFRRAKAFQKLMNANHAMSDYDEAIRLDPNQARFYLGRASLFNQLSKPALVRADVERARRCNPDLPAQIRFQGDPFPSSVQRSASIPDRN